MRKVSAIIAVIMAAMAPGRVFSCVCSCDASYTPDRYVAEAEVILVGRFLGISLPDHNSDGDVEVVSSCGRETLNFSVTEPLRGQLGATMSFVRSDVGTNCDFKFKLKVGKKYLMFGLRDKRDGTLYASGCSPSAPERRARALIAAVKSKEHLPK